MLEEKYVELIAFADDVYMLVGLAVAWLSILRMIAVRTDHLRPNKTE